MKCQVVGVKYQLSGIHSRWAWLERFVLEKTSGFSQSGQVCNSHVQMYWYKIGFRCDRGIYNSTVCETFKTFASLLEKLDTCDIIGAQRRLIKQVFSQLIAIYMDVSTNDRYQVTWIIWSWMLLLITTLMFTFNKHLAFLVFEIGCF